MTLYDATLPMREGMITFPGDPPFRIETFFETRKGDPFNLALLHMGTHLGTHVDPPAHYLEGGATVDQVPLDVLVGPGVFLDLRGQSSINRKTLENAPIGDARRVLFRTDNETLLGAPRFREDFTALTEDGARYLVKRGVRLVGIDYLSIEQYMNPGAPVHRTLLGAGVLVV
ncbi:MAG: cyclase family protein, partial [Deltaproteobacteria bacterium]